MSNKVKFLSLLPICFLLAISIYSYSGGEDGDQKSSGCVRASEGPVNVKFQDVKRFDDFKIHVDGLIVGSELLPAYDKMMSTYYELCCSQNMLLHDHLIEGLGSKLVTAMICKTTDIATAIKSLSLVPSLRDLECWDKTLKSFEDLGMSVGFLRARIVKLVNILRKYVTVNESWNAKSAQVEEKTRAAALKREVWTMGALAESIAALKASIDKVVWRLRWMGSSIKLKILAQTEYFEVAAAPWS